jgi:putative MATE family efflux protein
VLDRKILAMALPALGAIAAEPLYNLADTSVVSHLGRQPLDALAVAGTSLTVIGWVVAFIATSTATAVARARSSDAQEQIGRSVGAAYLVAISLGALVAVVLSLVAPEISRLLLGNDRPVIASVSYLRLSAFGLPFLFVSFAGMGHFNGLANAGVTFRIAVVSNVLNLVLEVVLVFGLGLGLRGSALGTVIAQVFAATAYAFASFRLVDRRPRTPRFVDLKALLQNGVELTARTLALAAVPIALTAIAARLGADALAGNQIALRVWLALALLLDALAVPAQVYVSEALGSGDVTTAREVGRRVFRLGALAGLVVATGTAAAALFVPELLSPSGAVQADARLALLIGACLQPLAAGAFVLDGLVLGLGDYAALRRTMIFALAGFAPLAALSVTVHTFGLGLLWCAYGTWLACRIALLRRRWNSAIGGEEGAGRTV